MELRKKATCQCLDIGASHAVSTESRLCVLRPCTSQRVIVSQQCQSWILGSQTAVSIAINDEGVVRANYAGSMLLMFS